jgi:hypothetical protein
MFLLLVYPPMLGDPFHLWGTAVRDLALELAERLYFSWERGRRSWNFRFDLIHRITFLELNLLFALVGGYVTRALAIPAETVAREDGPRNARRDS